MDNRISKQYLPLKDNEQTNKLKIETYYSKGGMNYFSGRNENRGIYLSISPVQVSSGDGYSSESYTAFTGTKVKLLELKRWSKKYEDFEPTKEQLDSLVQHVCKQNNLELCEQ